MKTMMKIMKKQIFDNLKDISQEEKELLERAFLFAENAHHRQERKSQEPYINHPLRVALLLSKMKLGANTIIAGLLHDILEDADIPLEEIKSNFNDEVAFLVQALTKINKIKYKKGETDMEKENFRNMILAMTKDIRVILIKLSDRLDNMKTIWALDEEKQKKKAMETLEIFAPLAYRLGLTDIGAQLEDYSFPYAYPEEYKLTRKIVGKRREELENYLKKLVPLVEKRLNIVNLSPLKIKFRAKHLYSIWRKLQKEEMDIKRVYDLVAMRLIFSKVEECYAALGIIHEIYKPMPGRFKDYIALPKPNGYRSLHTAVFAEEGRIVEIQIRTKEMDEEAEWGIASSWLYDSMKNSKSYKKRKSFIPPKRFYWLNQLQEWQKKFYNSRNFLEYLKVDFFKDRIFVLTPKGEIVDLPDGATPVDFAYQIHTEVGNQAASAKINGKLTPLDSVLKSGDMVEIIVQKNKMPSSKWLEFVKMAEVRKKIQEVVKKQKEKTKKGK